MSIEGPRIYLRPLTPSDATERYLGWLRDPEVTRFLESRHIQHSLQSVERYIREATARGDEELLAICRREDDRHIGNLKIGAIHPTYGRADIGLLIGEKSCWGQGYAGEAIALASRYAFDELGLVKLEAGCYDANAASARAFMKCGYRQEGRLRRHARVDGRPCDVILLGLTVDDLDRGSNPSGV